MGTMDHRLTGSPAFRDPVAAAIWRARVEHKLLSRDIIDEPLDVTRARAIAKELNDALEAAGHVRDGWKMVPFMMPPAPGVSPGGTDEATGETFGRGAPYTSPIYKAHCLDSPCTLYLKDFALPVLEIELGVGVQNGRAVHTLACVEIEDLRYPREEDTFPRMIADFDHAGVMVYGSTTVPVEQMGASLQTTMSHNGELIQVCEVQVPDCIRRATNPLPERPVPGLARVATGTVLNPPDLLPGLWVIDFGPLGALEITAVA
jgi:hypothetical protein